MLQSKVSRRISTFSLRCQPRLSKPASESESESRDDEEQADAGHNLVIKMNMEKEKYLELGKKKRVTVRTFKGELMSGFERDAYLTLY